MKYPGIKKLYYSISEVSEMLDIKQSVIRYWESEYKDLKPQKNRAGNRIYKKGDIKLIRLIQYYVHGKHLSIQEAAEMIRSLREEGLYERKIAEITPPEDIESGEETEEEYDNSDEIEEEEDSEEKAAIEAKPALQDEVEAAVLPKEKEEISLPPVEQKAGALLTDKPKEAEDLLPFPAELELPLKEQSPELEKEVSASTVEVQDNCHEEMRNLLQKISSNIRDIINILKETGEQEL